MQRRNHVLQRMLEEKYISQEEASQAQAEPLNLRPRKEPPSIAPYFLEEVRKYLEREYGSQRIYQGGLRVYTTLDPAMQEAATRAVRKGLRTPGPQGPRLRALARLHPEGRASSPTRAPRRVGPADRARATSCAAWCWPRTARWPSCRSGSTARGWAPRTSAWTRRTRLRGAAPRAAVAPFLVVSLTDGGRSQGSPGHPRAGAEAGGRPPRHRAAHGRGEGDGGRLRLRAQQVQPRHAGLPPGGLGLQADRLRGGPGAGGLHARHHHRGRAHLLPREPGAIWSPHNYDYTFWGPIPVRHAIEQSRNIPAIKTLQVVGIKTGIEYARKLGLTGALPPYLPLAIGAGEATPAGDDGGLRHLRQPGPAHEADVRHAHHRPRGQRRRGGAAPGRATPSAPTPRTS